LNKDWPNVPRIGGKPSFTLVKLIEVDAKLHEFEYLEETFEKDEILEI
jgi:hypothetical protein